MARDREIRARLKGGDADSVLNLVLFRTSFTAQPRVTGKQMEAAGDHSDVTGRLILARVRDMAQAAARPGRNERLKFAAESLKENGADPSAPAAGKRVEAVLLENALRVLREQREYAKPIEEAKRKEDAAGLFVIRSSLYRSRGLSLDTSFRPNYGIERSLAEMKSAGLLRTVRSAAVLGPGLWRQSDNVPFEQSRNVLLTAPSCGDAGRTTTNDLSRKRPAGDTQESQEEAD